jgi:hypothetical protein
MQKARVANPGPAGLLVINPKRGKSMATKRRRSATAAATKRRTTTRRKSNPTSYASKGGRAMTRRRSSVSRRRNPSTGGLLTQAAGLAAGITAVGLLQSFIPPIGGVSPFMVAARQGATGWLVGEGMQRFGVMRQYANDVKLAGLALGVGTLINAFILPTVSGFLRPAPRQPQQGNGMQGIAAVPSIPAYLGSAPMPAAQGVNGIAVYQSPGRFGRR